MKNAKKGSNKNLSYIMRFGMTVLTVILIVLFFSIMIMVGQIQGTARIVNYAGLVRGGTQRMVKLEDAGELIRALRFAAQNRILQKKVYLDEATGLPNKNK